MPQGTAGRLCRHLLAWCRRRVFVVPSGPMSASLFRGNGWNRCRAFFTESCGTRTVKEGREEIDGRPIARCNPVSINVLDGEVPGGPGPAQSWRRCPGPPAALPGCGLGSTTRVGGFRLVSLSTGGKLLKLLQYWCFLKSKFAPGRGNSRWSQRESGLGKELAQGSNCLRLCQ